ncbi:MAG TPA: TSUP family transporter, partial [Thermoanaerobaculia bacterium]|nr:TSUP family transporter [Thermoanaerobaculia bacterium]
AGAMMAFHVPKEAFVATSTAIGLIVDGARVPVYLVNSGASLLAMWPLIAGMTVAVVAGTLAGRAVLARLNEETFRRAVSGLIGVLGVWLLVRG